jgi:NADH-quinone oxidoreductase subunit G
MGKKRALVLIGHLAQRHPRFAEIRTLAAALAELTGAQLGYLPEGANGVGAALVGFVPHRDIGGKASGTEGFNATSMLASPRHAYILFGAEPDADFAEGALAEQALEAADVVVAFTSFVGESLRKCADVLLPIAAFAETPGTYVNAEGRWQSFTAAAEPVGEARPGWRVLRVLGNALGVPEFEYRSAEGIRDEIRARVGDVTPENSYRGSVEISFDEDRVEPAGLDVPIYAIDSLVRRSQPLQQTVQAQARDARSD